MRANRCSPPGRKRVSHIILFDAVQAAPWSYNHAAPSLTKTLYVYIHKILLIRSHFICTIWHICIFFFTAATNPPVSGLSLSPHSDPSSTSASPVSSPSPCVLLCFGEISAGNCESFTSCSHNGLWDYAKRSASAALPIDRHQRRPLEHTGKRWRALNEDVTTITQAHFTETLLVYSTSSASPFPTF